MSTIKNRADIHVPGGMGAEGAPEGRECFALPPRRSRRRDDERLRRLF